MENRPENTASKPVMVKAAVLESPGGEGVLTFSTRTRQAGRSSGEDPDSSLGRICRGIDHIYESFGRTRKISSARRSSMRSSERALSVRIPMVPSIDLSGIFKENPFAMLEGGGTSIQLDPDTARAIQNTAMLSVFYSDIAEHEGMWEIGDLPAVRDAVAEIITDSAKGAAERAFWECRSKAFEKTVAAVSDSSFYVNIIRVPGKSLAERTVFLNKGLVPSPTLRGDIFGSPYYAEHTAGTQVSGLCLRRRGDTWHFEEINISPSDLVSPISRLVIIPDTAEEKKAAGEMALLLSAQEKTSAVSDIFDAALVPVFDAAEKNARFMFSETLSAEILSKKTRKTAISKTALIEELIKKLGAERDMPVPVSAYSPHVPVYTRPKIKHSLIDSILGDIEDETPGGNTAKMEFKGRHGETFNIERADIKGEHAVCSIAAVLGGSKEGAAVLHTIKRQTPQLFEKLTEAAVLKISPGMTSKEAGLLAAEYTQKPECDREVRPDESTGLWEYGMEKNGLFQKLRHTLGVNRVKFHGYDMNDLTAEEVSGIINNLGILDSSDYSGDRQSRDPLDPDRAKRKDFYWSTMKPEERDKWAARIPETLRPYVQGSGTMTEKPGNVTWYYPMRADNPAVSLDREFFWGIPGLQPDTLSNAYFEEDAKFHTICQNYEFFNTRAIRKYMGFAAPFIGPAYDAVQTYAIDPALETEHNTVSFADGVRERICSASGDICAEESVSLVSEETETLADCVRKYGWFDDFEKDHMPDIRGDRAEYTEKGISGEHGTAPYHELGLEEYENFLAPTVKMNSYEMMDRVFDLYVRLGEREFAEYMERTRPFETDWFNPFATAKDGFTRYLARTTEGRGFELLPKEHGLDPSLPKYYEDALSFENLEKKNSRDEFAWGNLKERDKFNCAGGDGRARPLGVEPYTEPFGSSRTGVLIRPLESLRFLNTLSRSRRELEDRCQAVPEEWSDQEM